MGGDADDQDQYWNQRTIIWKQAPKRPNKRKKWGRSSRCVPAADRYSQAYDLILSLLSKGEKCFRYFLTIQIQRVSQNQARQSRHSDCCLGQHYKGGQNWSIFSKNILERSKENSWSITPQHNPPYSQWDLKLLKNSTKTRKKMVMVGQIMVGQVKDIMKI